MILRAGIIGCGDVAGGYDMRGRTKQATFTHAGVYSKDSRFEIIVASDINAERLAEFVNYWGIDNVYVNYKELVKEVELDIISICTPDVTHYEIGEYILKHGSCKVLFIEKPIVLSSEDAKALIVLAKERNIRIVVNYHRRWDTGHNLVADLIEKNELGDVVSVTGYYVKGLIHVGCTMINTLRFLFGEIESAGALGQTKSDAGDSFSIDFWLKMKSGTRCFVHCADRLGYGYSLFEIDIIGNKSRVLISDNGKKISQARLGGNPDYSGGTVIEDYDMLSENSIYNAMTNGLDDIYRLVTKPGHVSVNEANEAVIDMAWIEEIIKSFERKSK